MSFGGYVNCTDSVQISAEIYEKIIGPAQEFVANRVKIFTSTIQVPNKL